MNLTRIQKSILVLLIGILIICNVYLFQFVKNQISSTSANRVEAITLDLEDDIKDKIEIYSNMMYAIIGVVSTVDNLTEEKWHLYMDFINVHERYPGVRSVVYAPVMNSSERDQFTQSIRSLGQSDFTIYPDIVTEQIAPVIYIHPKQRNGVVARKGFNIFSDQVRAKALSYARDNNTLAITEKVTLIGDLNGEQEPGFVLYLPMYKKGSSINTVEERRAAFIGVIAAGLRMREFMDGVLSDYYQGLDFQIFDGNDAKELQLTNIMYNSGDNMVLQPGYVPKYSKIDEIEWPNGSWYIRYVTSPNFGLTTFEKALPYLMVLRNIALSLFLLWVLYRIFVKRNAKQKIDQDLSKLSAENAVIDTAKEGIIVTDSSGIIKLFNKKAEKVLGYSEAEAIGKLHLLNMLSNDTLEVYAAKVSQALKESVEPSFETLITNCLVEGRDVQKWLMVTKNGMPINLDVTMRPLYDKDNGLIGYQFNLY